MADPELRDENLPTLIDRLIDHEPKVRHTRETPMQSLRQLKASLRRDIEWLLNARRSPVELHEEQDLVARSVFHYGLPDITSFSLASPDDQSLLVRMIEQAIRAFEPRLSGIQVSLMPMSPGSRVLKFQIEGLFMIEPAPERILFDTKLELTSGEYEVGGEPSA